MKTKPIKVKVLSQEGNSYHIQFPYLEVPVTVNEQLYKKMLKSADYKFISSNTSVRQNC